MDNRDKVIQTQLEVIGSLINNNIRRMSDDFWGAPQNKAKPESPSSKDGAPASGKDPAKAAEFLNFAFTNGEFIDLINWGIEGEDWVKNEDGMAAYPEGVDANSVAYHNDYGFAYPNQYLGTPWEGNPTDIWEQYQTFNEELPVSPAFGFTFDSRDVSTELAQCTSVYEEYSKDLAFGTVEIEPRLAEFNGLSLNHC